MSYEGIDRCPECGHLMWYTKPGQPHIGPDAAALCPRTREAAEREREARRRYEADDYDIGGLRA